MVTIHGMALALIKDDADKGNKEARKLLDFFYANNITSIKKQTPYIQEYYKKRFPEQFIKNPISEKTAHKLRKAAPGTFAKMTDEEIKKAVRVPRKRVKKNPVKGGFYVGFLHNKIVYYYKGDDLPLDSERKSAISFTNNDDAIKKAMELQKRYRKFFSVYYRPK